MKKSIHALTLFLGAALVGAVLAFAPAASAADAPANSKDAKLKPYPLKTCLVSDEKLGGMGDPFVHKYQDRELKFCCKGCLKDFNKEPAKYIKKLEAAEKSAKSGKAAPPAHDHSGHQH